MKTNVSQKMMMAVNNLKVSNYSADGFEVFIHGEDCSSEYWGIWSWRWNKCYIVCRHRDAYSAYECKDKTHVRYMMIKMAF